MKRKNTSISWQYLFIILNQAICIAIYTKNKVSVCHLFKKRNLTLIHQSDQLQICLQLHVAIFVYTFFNEMNKGSSYFDLLQVFDINDTNKNERLIENYFKNI